MERFGDINKYTTKSCPSWKSGKSSQNWHFLISTSNYQRYTKFTTRYIFGDDKYDEVILKKVKGITINVKTKDCRQKWPKSFSIWNQSVSHSWYCLYRTKTKVLNVLCVFIANYNVNSEKSGIHGLPEAVFKMSAVENRKKPNLGISVTQLLFIRDS